MKRAVAILAFWLAASAAGYSATLHRDVAYGQAGGERLLCDVSVPDGIGPFPVAILVHGGGWSRGNKSDTHQPNDSANVSPWFPIFTAANFTWFSIDYRLAPAHRWPACLDDLQTAIRWVKAHAAEYRGDPAHIVLVGHSSGGHLVCLAAVLAGPDTQVSAVAGFAAVTDLESDSERRGGLSTSLQKLLNRPKELTPATRVLLREMSPIDRVHPGLPAFLLLHGTADRTVPFAQSVAFQQRVRAAGGLCDLIAIPDAPHSLLSWSEIAPDYPERMIAWLRAVFADRKPPTPAAASSPAPAATGGHLS